MSFGIANRLILLAMASGCAHWDFLTQSEHRAAAATEERKAEEERQQYVPQAADPDLHAPYNPTADHLRVAEAHLRVAHQHTQAALQEQRFEDEACASLSTQARASCPLVSGAVQTVEEIRGGVRLHLKPGSNGAELIARMRCHLAFARARGFEGLSGCPLYYRSAGVDLVGLGEVIEVRATETAAAAAIRRDAREIFASLPSP
jgi:hypothetical protein